MNEMSKWNRAIIPAIGGLLLFGLWIGRESKNESEPSVPVETAIHGETGEMPMATNADILALLPVIDPVPSVCSPPVTKNGQSATNETPIKTLPPDAPLIEDPNDEIASMSDEPIRVDGENAEIVKKNENETDEWIPFVYFYGRSPTPWGPVRTLSVYPMVATETANGGKASAPPCPVAVFPVYPVMPVFPVVSAPSAQVPIFTPKVVPSRFGAPRLVYPNGVVIKPKVYYPNQKVRNVLRAVTP